MISIKKIVLLLLFIVPYCVHSQGIKRNGKGKIVYDNGEIDEGEFENGRFIK
tara:strand:- start:671 stop:826 length:156 start_codon:yes stop_codon:yes gene_type:complete